MTNILEADSIQLSFGMKRILSNVYLKVESGKITGLLGRNGTGKTCLMNIIYGSLESESKSTRWNDKAIFYAFKASGLLSYLPQFNFIPLRLRTIRIFNDFGLDFSEFEKIFPEFSSSFHLNFRELSGGQRRLIEVYIITKSKAQFVLLDEPFSHIMPLHIEKIKKVLKEEKCKKGILLTDHMYHHITDISDSLYVLKDGQTYLTKGIEDIERLGYARLKD